MLSFNSSSSAITRALYPLTPSSSSSSSSICLKPNTQNFFFLRRSPFPGKSISTKERRFSVVATSDLRNESKKSCFQGAESFFRSILASMESVYLNRNPTAKAILELVRSNEDDKICYDHFAFRTFGVNGYGIDSMAKIFLDFGYTQREELRFPAKKLKALWFSPPSVANSDGGSGVNGPLPRVFISELLVDQLSPEAQEIIRKYTELSGSRNQHAASTSALGSLTWEKPLYSEFQQLARESEYAAWTLVNGYALNHVTISTHKLKSELREIKNLNRFIKENGFKLNSEGGTLKDSISFEFYDGKTESVPCSYIKFAECLVLPKFSHLPEKEGSLGCQMGRYRES